MLVFKDRLKGLREDRDLTQEELAEFLKITRSALGNYETGLREPDISTLVKISDFFNISLDYLLCRTNIRVSFSKLYKKSK